MGEKRKSERPGVLFAQNVPCAHIIIEMKYMYFYIGNNNALWEHMCATSEIIIFCMKNSILVSWLYLYLY